MSLTRNDKRVAFDKVVARYPDLAIKGKAMPYVAMNGNMFAFLGQDDALAFRLSERDRTAFEAAHGPSEVRQYGSVMRGYVALPESLIEDETSLSALFQASVDFARTLKPKPTKK